MNDIPSRLAQRVQNTCRQVTDELLQQRNAQGHWTGELSSSPLATATAISALSRYRDLSVEPVLERSRISEMIDQGSSWLLNHQNPDGGWGDTDESHSNVATSMLAVAALTLAGKSDQGEFCKSVDLANAYIDRLGRTDALRKRYGKDKTFAVPILANCAIAGLVPWKEVSALPFEAVLLPQKFYRFIDLPVVSYAVPALVAIGQLKFLKDPPWNPVFRLLRKLSMTRGLDVLEKMQPASGGFLEAIPLTCFVAMSLAHSGRADHDVVHRCIQFVADSFRSEGATGTWPIDTNLATWNTTLAINAIGPGKNDGNQESHLTLELLDWLLGCQHTSVHPFTGADPGGWGWSDLSGAVPDADDTPGALLAFRKWFDNPDSTDQQRARILTAAESGVRWLLDLQNRDKGWPTFCRGWGRLPFDRSGNDITAHVIRSLIVWQDVIDEARIPTAIERGFNYLTSNAIPQGGWLPLWFGNQDHPDEENPVYGTVKVLLAWLEAERIGEPVARKAIEWLLVSQNDDFGWGGGPSNGCEGPTDIALVSSSLQETSLVLELLTRITETPEFAGDPDVLNAVTRGTDWILAAVEAGKTSEKWPIGFYFAKLWYYEGLYPLVFCTSAMHCLARHFGDPVLKNSEQKITLS